MKKLKLTLSILVVLALFFGLFIRGIRQNSTITKQEYLFDTLCTISVYSKKDAKAIDKAFSEAAKIHSLADFYGSSSDASRINREKKDTPITVDSHTINMLSLAQEIYKKSGGCFDVTIAPISKLWNFSADSEKTIPSASEIKTYLPLVNCDYLSIDSKNMTVTKALDDIQIDLGGIAKGYAADIAAKALKDLNVKSALIDFGGNIVTVGKNPKSHNKKWRIGLQTPFAPTGEYSKIVEVGENQAVVTSGTYQRYFSHNNTNYHHILNPKTGYPKMQDYESVTVISNNASVCDCLATAIFVMGEKSGRELAQEYNAQVYFLP